MAFASEKNAYGICDRCGFRYGLRELRKEWNGYRTCPECYEPKHPQLDVKRNLADPEALNNPRVDTSVVPRNFTVYTNWDLGIIGTALTVPDALSSSLGTITITGATGSTPSPSPSPTPSPTPSPSYTTYTVTVANYLGSNYFYIDGSRAATLNLTEGQTYRFDQSASSNSSHPLRFSTTSDGTHSGGSEYTTGVTTNGTAGSSGAYTQIEVASSAPTLYYYCTNHSGMGGQINTV